MKFQEYPTIRLTFDGLILFHFGKNKSHCEARILRAPEHKLQIKITGSPTVEQVLTDGIQAGDLLFEVLKQGQGVTPFEGASFDRTVGGDWDRDFRWVVDLAGKDFHNHKLHHIKAPAQAQSKGHAHGPAHHGIEKTQVLTINQGQFYTAGKYKVTKLCPKSFPPPHEEVIWVASRIGCNVTLGAGKTAILQYGPKDNRHTVEFPEDHGAHYEIAVENNRPDGAIPPTPQVKEDLVHSSDFHHYYELFDIEPAAQFKIARYVAPGATPFHNDEFPCDPATCGCGE